MSDSFHHFFIKKTTRQSSTKKQVYRSKDQEQNYV
jgi:hypothetical protein